MSRTSRFIWALAAATFAFHFYFNNQYGYFRDEFNYIACGEHLDWGFVDHPPLIPLLVKICRALFGDSLRVIRLVPSLAGAFMVVQGAALARQLKGGPYAAVLTALAIALAPIYLSDASLLTTNCMEPLLWMGCVQFALRAIDGHPRYWVAFGAVLGLGMEEKYSIAIFAAALVLALLLVPERKFLWNRWIWLGGGVALLLFLPNLLWNAEHHWPFLELMRNLRSSGRDVLLSPPRYFAEQILLVGPINAPLWLAGLGALTAWPRLKHFRFLAWSYVLTFAFFALSHGKNYYLAPAYPMLLAAGAVCLGSVRSSSWKTLALAVVVVSGLLAAPITMPVLSPEKLTVYLDRLPFDIPRSEVSHRSAALPQYYADQFGWTELAELVGREWARLPQDDRQQCGIFAQNYGEAGALDFLGRRFHLPPVLSGHQSYFLWGAHNYSGKCLLVVGERREARLRELFESVEFVGVRDANYALESSIPVYLCRGPKFGTLQNIWPMLKRWS